MKARIPAFSFLLVVVITGAITGTMTACNQTPPPAPADTRAADAQAIRDDEAAWVKDWNSKNIDSITSHYASDAVLYINNMPAMNGVPAIKAGMTGMIADPNLSLSFQASAVEVAKAGDLAYSRGVYTLTVTDPKTKKKIQEKGKYVTVYAKQSDGSWKAVADIDNPDAPATPVA